MARKSENLHEDLDRDEEVKVGSEKGFGIVFAVVFLIIGLFPLIKGGTPYIWSLSLAAAFLILGFFLPKALTPLNILWFKFGLFLHMIINPLVMGMLFFLTVTPIGLIMRMLGKRPLSLDFEPEADTYWVKRDPPGPDPKQMSKQF